MKTTRRLFALLMVVCLLAGYAVMPVYAADPAATLSFETTDNRVSVADEEQVWQANGITLTNDVGESTNPIKDYFNPVRLYQGTTVKIEYPGMTKIVFHCAGGKVVKENSIGELGTVTTEDAVVTLTLPEAKDFVEFSVAAQIRLSKIEVYTGAVSGGNEGGSEEPEEPVVPTNPVEIVDAAYALAEDESLPYTATLTGEITEISTAYDSSWKNISVVIAVKGCEDKPILCYRLSGEGAEGLAVGDTITVTGTIKNYKGTIEFVQGCTLDAVVKGEGEVPVAPEDLAEIVNAAYALEDGKSLPYSATLTGTVVMIDTPYDEGYKNISVVIEVSGCEDKPLLCFRMKGDEAANVALGDTITVTGTLTNYQGIIEFKSGCTLDALVKAPGSSAENPVLLYVNLFEMGMDGVSATYTVTVPANTTYHYALYMAGGKEMTINGENPVMLTGNMMVADTFTITNDGAEAADYVITLVAPAGSRENPVGIWNPSTVAEVPAGCAQGYYLSYSAWNPGTLVLTPTCDDESVEFNVMLTNMSTYEQAWLSDSKDGTVSVEMAAYDQVMIQIEIYPNGIDSYPAANIALNGEIIAPVGSSENPEPITESATATLEAGSWGYYYSYTAPAYGAVKVTVSGDGWVYCVNNLTAEKYGDNHQSDEDPVVAEVVPVSAGDELQIMVNTYDPANLWEAPAGEVSVALEFIEPIETTAGETIDIMRTEWLWNDEQTEATLTVSVPAGKVNTYTAAGTANMMLSINDGEAFKLVGDMRFAPTFEIANDLPVDRTYNLKLFYPVGSRENPEILYDTSSFGTNLEAGNDQGYYFTFYSIGTGKMVLTPGCTTEGVRYNMEVTNVMTGEMLWLSDSTDGTISFELTPYAQYIVHVAATEDAQGNWYPAAEIVVTGEIVYPLGSYENPADLVEGENKVALEEGSDGYHFDFIAPSDGTVTVTVSGENWQYNVANTTTSYSSDYHCYNDDPVVATETVKVKKGDVIVVMVNTYDPEIWWVTPAGEVTVTFGFESDVLLGDCNGDGVVGIADLMRLANHFAKGTEINVANSDCNGDGVVGIADLMRLANHFAKGVALG